MNYHRVGKSGLVVSGASLGSWLTYGDSVDQQNSTKIIHTAYDHGITSFDTANVYNIGATERGLSKALSDLPRTKIVVASKVFFPMGEGQNEKGLSRKAVIEQTNASLDRLEMDYLDILYCHRYDPNTPLQETLRAIDDLIRQGKVLYFGVSEWTAAQIVDAMHLCDRYLLDRMIVSQPSYSLLNRSIEKEVLPTCQEYGVGQMVFSALSQGMLTGKYKRNQDMPAGSRGASAQGKLLKERYLNDGVFDKLEKMEILCKECGIPMHHMALAWAYRTKGVSSVILGASRAEQVIDNLKAFELTLSDDVVSKLEEIFPR